MSRPIFIVLCVLAGLALASTTARSEQSRVMVCEGFINSGSDKSAQRFAEFGNAQLAAGKTSFLAEESVICAW